MLSVSPSMVGPVGDRWTAEQVLGLAPAESAAAAARRLASPAPWSGTGATAQPPVVWGSCQGSGATPYQTAVDLAGDVTGPAFRCSCPSRRIPCKHALGLLLLWSDGRVEEAEQTRPPEWVSAWLTERSSRAERAAQRAARTAEADPAAAERSAAGAEQRRQQRVSRATAGLDELDTWLRDQVRAGLAGTDRTGYAAFEAVAARMVDAQAPGVAGVLRRLPAVLVTEGWPERLLEEYALLHLLVVAHRNLDRLPEGLAATVRSRVGYPTAKDDVLAGPAIRDRWAVLGLRDTAEDRLTVRRIWLRGERTGELALVLSFAPPGQPLDSSLVPGTAVEADLHFYPATPPQRALVGVRHSAVGRAAQLDPAQLGGLEAALGIWATALAADPWTTAWPVLIADAVPVPPETGPDQRWWLGDPSGAAVPLLAGGLDRWQLLALSGGHPLVLLGELTPGGLRPVAVPAAMPASDPAEGPEGVSP